ncbi:hypothetical protein [Prauserella oleivorans]
MSVLHAAATVALAKIAVFQPGETSLMTAVALALLVGAAALWSAVDAWLRLRDAGRTWFIAALVTGPVAGVLSVLGRSVFVDQTGLSELGPALTGGAAFTALLVLLPAGLGLVVGGRLAGQRDDEEEHAEPGQEDTGSVAAGRSRGEPGSGRRATARPRPRPQPRAPRVGPSR